jgi:hypothetical protein
MKTETIKHTGCERYCRPFFKVVCGLNRSSDCDVIQSAVGRAPRAGVRGAIVTGIRAGRTNREIADFNNISVNTVKSFSREYHRFIEEGGQDEDFDLKRKQHRRRSDAHGVEMVAKVQEAINEDPGRSMRKLAEELEVSEGLIRKIVKQDIHYRSYSLRRGQFMTAATKRTRFEKASALLNRLKHPPVQDILIFFSDEKNFSQDQKVNSRNNRWLCDDPS